MFHKAALFLLATSVANTAAAPADAAIQNITAAVELVPLSSGYGGSYGGGEEEESSYGSGYGGTYKEEEEEAYGGSGYSAKPSKGKARAKGGEPSYGGKPSYGGRDKSGYKGFYGGGEEEESSYGSGYGGTYKEEEEEAYGGSGYSAKMYKGKGRAKGSSRAKSGWKSGMKKKEFNECVFANPTLDLTDLTSGGGVPRDTILTHAIAMNDIFFELVSAYSKHPDNEAVYKTGMTVGAAHKGVFGDGDGQISDGNSAVCTVTFALVAQMKDTCYFQKYEKLYTKVSVILMKGFIAGINEGEDEPIITQDLTMCPEPRL